MQIFLIYFLGVVRNALELIKRVILLGKMFFPFVKFNDFRGIFIKKQGFWKGFTSGRINKPRANHGQISTCVENIVIKCG